MGNVVENSSDVRIDLSYREYPPLSSRGGSEYNITFSPKAPKGRNIIASNAQTPPSRKLLLAIIRSGINCKIRFKSDKKFLLDK
jgi:hypothetical protein